MIHSDAAGMAPAKRAGLCASAAAYFMLQRTGEAAYLIGVPVACLVLFAALGRTGAAGRAEPLPGAVRILAALSAAGMCLGGMAASMSMGGVLSGAGSFLLAAAAFPAACAWCVHAWAAARDALRAAGLPGDMGRGEAAAYGAMLALILAGVAAVYSMTDAFRGADSYDVLYTLDSACASGGGVFVRLAQAQNDIRQPLFALFAGPFAAWAVLSAVLLDLGTAVLDFLLQASQIAMMLAGDVVLASALGLLGRKRVLFVAFMRCMYSGILYSLAMEQYQAVHFWLMACVAAACAGREPGRTAVYGACGTLLAGAAMVPFLPDGKAGGISWRGRIARCFGYGIGFLAAMLAACRLDVMAGLAARLRFLSSFAGGTPWRSRILQYLEFLRCCFLAPDAGPVVRDPAMLPPHTAGVSWQMAPAAGVGAVSVLVLAGCAASVILCRDRRIVRAAAGWLGLSFLVLAVVGWGAPENGIVLYSLYFGWPMPVLLYALAGRIGEKAGLPWLAPALAGCGIVALLALNAGPVLDMIAFAAEAYPC